MNDSSTTQSEVTPPTVPTQEPPMMFLGIGVVINVLLVTAYFVWAWKQGKKRDRPDD